MNRLEKLRKISDSLFQCARIDVLQKNGLQVLHKSIGVVKNYYPSSKPNVREINNAVSDLGKSYVDPVEVNALFRIKALRARGKALPKDCTLNLTFSHRKETKKEKKKVNIIFPILILVPPLYDQI